MQEIYAHIHGEKAERNKPLTVDKGEIIKKFESRIQGNEEDSNQA